MASTQWDLACRIRPASGGFFPKDNSYYSTVDVGDGGSHTARPTPNIKVHADGVAHLNQLKSLKF